MVSKLNALSGKIMNDQGLVVGATEDGKTVMYAQPQPAMSPFHKALLDRSAAVEQIPGADQMALNNYQKWHSFNPNQFQVYMPNMYSALGKIQTKLHNQYVRSN